MAEYSDINSLEETLMIGGSNFTFYYQFKQSDGTTAFNLTGMTVYLVLSPYSQPDYTILQKTATITNAAGGLANAAIVPSDTAGLNGKYIQQPVIVNGSTVYRPAQGVVTILGGITVSGG